MEPSPWQVEEEALGCAHEGGECSVCVKDEADSLQYPVADVLSSGKVSFKHQTHTHGITPLRCDVHWSTESILK